MNTAIKDRTKRFSVMDLTNSPAVLTAYPALTRKKERYIVWDNWNSEWVIACSTHKKALEFVVDWNSEEYHHILPDTALLTIGHLTLHKGGLYGI